MPTEALAELRPLTLRARDGMELPSYLALPPGAAPRGLPLVLQSSVAFLSLPGRVIEVRGVRRQCVGQLA